MVLGAAFSFGDVNFWAIIFAVIMSYAGWLLISKRKSQMSVAGKIYLGVIFIFLCGWIIAFFIPGLVYMEYSSSQDSCVNNLRQLQAAKEEWALENGKTNGTLATAADLTPYVQLDSKGNLPKCPAGGTYIFGCVGEDVRCSIGNSDWPYRHVLNDTNGFTWWENFKEAYATLFGLHHVRK